MSPENTSLPAGLEERLRFETLIADLSSKFIHLPPGEVDREITDAQRRVCECLSIDAKARKPSPVKAPPAPVAPAAADGDLDPQQTI